MELFSLFHGWSITNWRQSHFTADSQSVSLGVEPTLWTFDQILLPFQVLGLKCLVLSCLVLSLWGALSDKRPGLSFVSHSLVIYLCVHLLFTFLSFTPLPHVSKSKSLYDWQSVSQYVLVSSTLVALATRYYFLSECCCLKFAVLYLLGTLSDERTGLQFAV
jgi:hypothetical protein